MIRTVLLMSLMSLVMCGLAPSMAPARTLETRDQAFARLFPVEAAIDRQTVFLSEEQMQRVQKQGRARLQQARVTFYVVTLGDSLLGRAYLDTHPVRSRHETLLIVLRGDGGVNTVDVLAFHEPEDYLPRRAWYERLSRLRTPRATGAGNGVDTVSGATLTVNATCEALRRISNIDEVLFPQKQQVAP